MPTIAIAKEGRLRLLLATEWGNDGYHWHYYHWHWHWNYY